MATTHRCTACAPSQAMAKRSKELSDLSDNLRQPSHQEQYLSGIKLSIRSLSDKKALWSSLGLLALMSTPTSSPLLETPAPS